MGLAGVRAATRPTPAGCGQPHGSRQNPGTQGQGQARRGAPRNRPHASRRGRPPACSTLLGYAGAHQLTLSCTLAELAIEPRSSYLGHPVADRMPPLPLERQPGQPPRVRLIEHDPRTLPVRHARRRCLLDHLAELRALVATITDQAVRVDVDDAALERIDHA